MNARTQMQARASHVAKKILMEVLMYLVNMKLLLYLINPASV